MKIKINYLFLAGILLIPSISFAEDKKSENKIIQEILDKDAAIKEKEYESRMKEPLFAGDLLTEKISYHKDSQLRKLKCDNEKVKS